MNPVLPSPWVSKTPVGMSFSPPNKKARLSSYFRGNSLFNVAAINAQVPIPRAHTHNSILKENKLFKNLNINTLILSFPEFQPQQIEAALVLCDNDLSDTISILRLRSRILKSIKLEREQKNAQRMVPLVKNEPPSHRHINYIPTKYTDVQIVEHPIKNVLGNNGPKIMEVNNDVLKMLTTYESSAPYNDGAGTPQPHHQYLPPTPVGLSGRRPRTAAENTFNASKFLPPHQRHPPRRFATTTSLESTIAKSEFFPSPSCSSSSLSNCGYLPSSTSSGGFDGKSHPFPPALHSYNSSQVLPSGSEYSPAPSTSSFEHSEISDKLKVYDFIEDPPTIEHFSKPKRKPLEKIGIVVRKGKRGFTVNLL